MVAYVLRRLLRALVTVFGVVSAVFFLERINGNPAAIMLPTTATQQQIAVLSKALGFDRPIPAQYLSFLHGVLHGDFGTSLQAGVPALGLVLGRLPATLELVLTGFALGVAMAVFFVLAIQLTGSHRLRMALLFAGQLRQAIPTFVFGVLMVLIFSVTLGLLPSQGIGSWRNLVLPAVTVATFEFALYLRFMDSSFGEQSQQDYVRTAYAKGAGRSVVVVRHELRNVLLPILTIVGLNLGGLLGGSVIIETVFNWPGIGQLTVESVNARDFPVVQASLLVASLAYVLVNIVVDLTYSAADPRARVR
jgi:peptide/nickel transport system permease protein